MLIITEINANLFNSKDPVYAHCVSLDYNMGAGIAVEFRKRYGQVGKLISQNVGIGGCSFLEVGDVGDKKINTMAFAQATDASSSNLENKKIIYYLVTKARYWNKPTYETLKRSLESMKEHLKTHPEIKSISIPKIGCGLDRLDWDEVKIMLESIFTDSTIENINVYYL